MAIVGLRRGYASVVHDTEIKPATTLRIIFAQQITQGVVQLLFGMDMHSDRKLLFAELQGLAVWNFDVTLTTVKRSGCSSLAIRSGSLQVDPLRLAMIGLRRVILCISRQLPVPHQPRRSCSSDSRVR